MASGFIKKEIPWTKKPDTLVRVNMDHPLAKNMIAFVMFNSKGESLYNAVTGLPYDEGTNNIDGTQLSRSFGEDGRSITGGSDNTGKLELHEDLIPNNYDFFTFLHKVKYKSNTVDQGFIMTGTVATTGTTLLWADYESGVGLRPGAYSGVADYGESNSLPVDEWVVWGANYSREGTAPKAQFYTNGEFDQETVDLGANNDAASTPFTYLSRYGADRPLYGECSWIAVWGVLNVTGERETFSPEQHRAFYNNPYQILQPQIKYIPIEIPISTGYTAEFYYKVLLSTGDL